MTSKSEEMALGVVVDLCTKSFLMIGSEGSERMIECDSTEEFMSVLTVMKSELDLSQIEFAEIAVINGHKRKPIKILRRIKIWLQLLWR